MSNASLARQALSPSQQALHVIEKLKSRINELESDKTEPIAIIGMGCRFPGGANEPAAYWQLLRNGVDAVSEVPADRWDLDGYFDADPGAPGKMYSRHGAFIRDIDRFDADFFGISPREAIRMDPQQRLLLEVTMAALEHAGQSVDDLKHGHTGVFIGACSDDYAYMNFSGDPRNIDAYLGLGTGRSITAGRLAYMLGLHGPTMQIDTACSSSLLAAHLACQSLKNRECGMAIVGGVNLLLTPGPSIFFCKVGALSPEGRCKTFDADANGYVRGEGCGIIVLKRLTDALDAGDPVIAVIKGSATNHDGPSGGLTVPNGRAQAMLIRQALENAGVTPSMMDYIETHGTGTVLGDAIEINALGEVFKGHRSKNNPLTIGSVKTNIGHLEAAAGMSGLIKLALALTHEEIPPHLHLRRPNPKIPWDRFPFSVPLEQKPWPQGEHGRTAGISSFGFSGTNVHMILAEPPRQVLTNVTPPERSRHVLTLSAKTENALKSLARHYGDYTQTAPEPSLAGICATATTGRSHYPFRSSIVADSVAQLRESLMRLGRGETGPGLYNGETAIDGVLSMAVLFGGDPVSALDAGRVLYGHIPAFKETVVTCDKLLAPFLGTPLSPFLEPDTHLDFSALGARQENLIVLALEYATFNAWQSLGVAPSVILGRGVGELAGAVAAGMFTLEDGIAMAADWDGVARGDAASLSGFNTTMGKITFSPVHTRLLSCVPSTAAPGEMKQPSYWIQRPKAHEDPGQAIRALRESGVTLFLDVGRDKVFQASDEMTGTNSRFRRLPVVSEEQPDWQGVLETLGLLYVLGMSIDWKVLYPKGRVRKLHLPTYPFQGRRYWMKDGKVTESGTAQPKTADKAPQVNHAGDHSPGTGGPVTGDANATLKTYYGTLAADAEKFDFEDTLEAEKAYIRFAPFHEPVPGFSWFLTMADPAGNPGHTQLVKAARAEMEERLFRGLDFSRISNVVDIGCGYARDIIAMARQHPHLRLDGLNITSEQIEIGSCRIRDNGLQDRISLYEMDSSKDKFPARYDMAIAFQVIHHIHDKKGVWENLGRHIRNGGVVVLAEMISNLSESIDHPESSAFFATRSEWSDMLTHNRFRILECVNASREVGNYLDDPDFNVHLESHIRLKADGTGVTREVLDLTRSHMEGPHLLGSLLRKELVLYGLITLQKDIFLNKEELSRINRYKLDNPTPYSRDAGVRPPLPDMFPAADTDTGPGFLSGTPDEQRTGLENYLCGCVAKVLETTIENVPRDASLIQLGLDSIMALELKKSLETELGIELPLEALVEGPSISDVTRLLLSQLPGTNGNRPGRQLTDPVRTNWVEGEL